MISGEGNLNPAELAETAVVQAFTQRDSARLQIDDAERLAYLDRAAAKLDMINKPYWVEATRGISLPVEFRTGETVNMIDFFKVDFEGTFLCYSKVVIGKILDGAGVSTKSNVDALCLTFHETTLLPYMEKLPRRHLMYVPVLAVDKIDQTAQAA